jgi:hypothetical protein
VTAPFLVSRHVPRANFSGMLWRRRGSAKYNFWGCRFPKKIIKNIQQKFLKKIFEKVFEKNLIQKK